MSLSICLYSRVEVFAETFAVNPRLNAVIITDIEDIEYIGKVAAVESVKHQNLGLRVERYGNRVVKNGGGCVSAPVDGIDAHYIWRAYDRFQIFYIGY